jgi:hypothetical protein
VPQDPPKPPQSLDELRRMFTPEMWADLRRAAPLARQALATDFPDRLILPRSFCLGFAEQWRLPDDPETISGLVHLFFETADESD